MHIAAKSRSRKPRRRAPKPKAGARAVPAERARVPGPMAKRSPRWPGLCPECGRPLECYHRNAFIALGIRRRYFRCSNLGCSYRTVVEERVKGEKPSAGE